MSSIWKTAFSAVLTCLSFCSSQLYEHRRVSAHIWSTLLCCKGTVLLLCFFFSHTHTLAHIFVRFGLVSRKLAILHTQKTICISSVFQSRAQASLTPFCVCVFQDKQGIPWWLGLSYKGIFQYDHQDKVKPRKVRQRFFETSVTYKTSKGCPLLTSMILFTCMMQYQRKVLFLYLFFCL